MKIILRSCTFYLFLNLTYCSCSGKETGFHVLCTAYLFGAEVGENDSGVENPSSVEEETPVTLLPIVTPASLADVEDRPKEDAMLVGLAVVEEGDKDDRRKGGRVEKGEMGEEAAVVVWRVARKGRRVGKVSRMAGRGLVVVSKNHSNWGTVTKNE